MLLLADCLVSPESTPSTPSLQLFYILLFQQNGGADRCEELVCRRVFGAAVCIHTQPPLRPPQHPSARPDSCAPATVQGTNKLRASEELD